MPRLAARRAGLASGRVDAAQPGHVVGRERAKRDAAQVVAWVHGRAVFERVPEPEQVTRFMGEQRVEIHRVPDWIANTQRLGHGVDFDIRVVNLAGIGIEANAGQAERVLTANVRPLVPEYDYVGVASVLVVLGGVASDWPLDLHRDRGFAPRA